MLSKHYESTAVYRRTWLNVPSETHQVVEIQKETFLRWIQYFQSDSINNMDYMRISGTKSSSVIL